MFTIRKKYTVEYAHALTDSYSIECQTIHGHSATIEVFLTTKELHETGMVIDFKKLNKFIKDSIIMPFDHVLIMPQSTDEDYLEVLCAHNASVMITPYNPTAENMAKDICEQVRDQLNTFWDKGPYVSIKVVFHETETGYAEYSENLR